MSDYNNFLGDDKIGSKDSQFNIFKFQDHLLEWISSSAHFFSERNYSQTFEDLTMLYADSLGFFTEKERKYIKDLFKKTEEEATKFAAYNVDYEFRKTKNRNAEYKPSKQIYITLLEFRIELMSLLAKHGLLMKMIDKSGKGAGDN